MAAPLRSNRLTFRRAAFASAAIHVVLAVTLLIVLRSRPEPAPRAPRIDTKADDVALRFLSDSVPVETRLPDPPAAEPPGAAPTPAPATDPGSARPPLASDVPRTLPPEMIAVIRRAAADPHVQPAASTRPAPAATPIHGALETGQTIVYVLDSSGSMGEHGKLDRARAALLATLRAQPEGVRFQVIAYNGSARVISGAGTAPATAANIAAAENRILAIEAAGRSNHAAAVRIATQCRPDLILIVTDAEELALAQFTPVLAAAGKPIVLCVAKVTATGILAPQAIR